jgi:2'-5' RNA ligase
MERTMTQDTGGDAGVALRLFVAIEPPEAVRQALQQLQRGAGVRWIAPEQLHLTLLFLENVPAEFLEPLCRALTTISLPAFDLALAGLGCFPSPRAPRVLWAGLERQPRLDELATAIRQAATAGALPVEERPFTPHLTLGRVREPARFPLHHWLQQPFSQCQFSVQEFALFRSLLTPRGAVHTLLQHFPLAPVTGDIATK